MIMRYLIAILFAMVSVESVAVVDLDMLDADGVQSSLCETQSSRMANYAKWISDAYERMKNTTQPNSEERKRAQERIQREVEKIEDDEFLYSKEFANKVSRMPGKRGLIAAMLSRQLQLALLVGVKEQGKSKVAYQRIIEERCILD